MMVVIAALVGITTVIPMPAGLSRTGDQCEGRSKSTEEKSERFGFHNIPTTREVGNLFGGIIEKMIRRGTAEGWG